MTSRAPLRTLDGPPARSSTPTKTKNRVLAPARGSPEVRARIAQLRAAKGSRKPVVEATVPDSLDGFELPPLDREIDRARKTGKLNISSRSLTSVPTEVWNELASKSSAFHPRRREPKPARSFASTKVATIDLGFSAADEDDGGGWLGGGALELTSFRAASNELADLDLAIGCFLALEQIDLKANALTTLPASIGLLSQLTHVNLSNNKLTAFPLVLLALDNLVELDLSCNAIASLWPASPDWRPQVRDLVTSALPSDLTQSPNSSAEGSFLAAFPSTPRRPGRSRFVDAEGHQTTQRSPLPMLKSLNLSDNRLKRDVFTDGFELPPNLMSLDLSLNSLVSPLPTDFFAPLTSLSSLGLSRNDLGDDIFASTDSSLLPALRTLDLGGNALESLERVEQVFADRSVSFLGLAPVLRNLVPTGTAQLTVTVTGNLLRDELWRRKEAQAAKNRADMAREAEQPSADLEEDGSLGDVLAKRMDALVVDTSGQSIVEAAYEANKGLIRLSGRSLDSLPVPPAEHSVAPVTLDLSRNVLSTFTLASMLQWGFHRSLRTLDLSQNRIAALQLVAEHESVQLEKLERLNVCNNRLPSLCSDGTPILAALARLCPSLQALDLSMNALTTLDGIDEVINGRLLSLRLANNQIESLTPLAELAQGDLQHWTVEELDLRDNAILKLPPALGRLPSPPLNTLLVAGNIFRIPHARVYSGHGGTVELLKWLHDRL